MATDIVTSPRTLDSEEQEQRWCEFARAAIAGLVQTTVSNDPGRVAELAAKCADGMIYELHRRQR